jgi:hypothetical protein
MNRSQIRWTRSILLAGVTLLLGSSVQAAGFGAYLEYARAGGYLEDDPYRFDYSTNKFGVGFAFDTNVAKNGLFNYRLNLGYQHSWREYDSGFEEAYNGFTMNHAFGFALYRGPGMRLWLGPALRLSADVLHEDLADRSVVNLSIGAGPQLGLNLHAGQRISIAFSAAYQYLYVGQVHSYDNYTSADTYDGGQHLGSLNLTFLFRTKGDLYKARPRAAEQDSSPQ